MESIMKKKYMVAATAAALSMGSGSAALAQQDEGSESLVFEEVIVTATKREQSIFDVPVAVTMQKPAPDVGTPTLALTYRAGQTPSLVDVPVAAASEVATGTVHVGVAGAKAVVLANDPSFSKALRTIPLNARPRTRSPRLPTWPPVCTRSSHP